MPIADDSVQACLPSANHWAEVRDPAVAGHASGRRRLRLAPIAFARPSLACEALRQSAGLRQFGQFLRAGASREACCRTSSPARLKSAAVFSLQPLKARFLQTETAVFGAVDPLIPEAKKCADLVARAAELGQRWPKLEPVEKRAILTTLVGRIELMRETLEIHILPGRLPSILAGQTDPREAKRREVENEPTMTLTVAAQLKRTGKETRFLIDNARGGARRKSDHSLCRVLTQAYQYNAMMMRNDGKTMSELAAQVGVGGSYFSRILRLSFLAPEVVKAVLRDRHPIELTAKRLAYRVRLPISWETQRTLLAGSTGETSPDK